MSRYALFDRQAVSLLPLAERGHDLTIDRVCPLGPPAAPLDHDDFPALLAAIRQAQRDQRPVIVLLGGHPIKLGLSRYLIDLMERGWITHLATNGAGIIHDFELALVGGTSENDRRGRFVPWNNGSRSSDIDSAGWLKPIRLAKTLTQHATAATALGGSAGPSWKNASPTPT